MTLRRHRLVERIQDVLRDPDKARFERLVKAGRIEVGTGTYGYPTVRVFVRENHRLIFGNYSSLALGATFLLGGGHPTDRITTFPLRIRLGMDGAGADGYPTECRDTLVGSDVWVGAGAVVLSGVNIGDGAIVAAGSLVRSDVPPYAIVAGNPARVIRLRFSEAEVASLLRISWWLWPESEIRSCVKLLTGANVRDFIAYASDRMGTPPENPPSVDS